MANESTLIAERARHPDMPYIREIAESLKELNTNHWMDENILPMVRNIWIRLLNAREVFASALKWTGYKKPFHPLGYFKKVCLNWCGEDPPEDVTGPVESIVSGPLTVVEERLEKERREESTSTSNLNSPSSQPIMKTKRQREADAYFSRFLPSGTPKSYWDEFDQRLLQKNLDALGPEDRLQLIEDRKKWANAANL